MSVDMTRYLWQILWAFLCGIVIGVLAIFLRIKPISSKSQIIFLKAKKKLDFFFGTSEKEAPKNRNGAIKRGVKLATDLFFGVFLGAFLAVFAYATNNGILRWFSLLTGGVTFFLTLLFLNAPLTMSIDILLHFVKCIARLCLKMLKKPCCLLAGVLLRLFLPIYRKCILIFLRIHDKIRIAYQKNKTKRNQKHFIKCVNKDIISWQKK